MLLFTPVGNDSPSDGKAKRFLQLLVAISNNRSLAMTSLLALKNQTSMEKSFRNLVVVKPNKSRRSGPYKHHSRARFVQKWLRICLQRKMSQDSVSNQQNQIIKIKYSTPGSSGITREEIGGVKAGVCGRRTSTLAPWDGNLVGK